MKSGAQLLHASRPQEANDDDDDDNKHMGGVDLLDQMVDHVAGES